MTYKIIEDLVEKLSCDFVLANPEEEPESLSGLLPILKQIHGKCTELSLDAKAKEVLKARKIITAVLKNNTGDVEKKMTALGEVISGLSSPISVPDKNDQVLDHTENSSSDEIADAQVLDRIEENLKQFADLISGYCPGEIPDLGLMLNILDELIAVSKQKKIVILNEVSVACKRYVEYMTLEDVHDTKPIEEGLLLLKSVLSHLKRGKVFAFDYSDVLALLNVKFDKEQEVKETEEIEEDPELEETAAVIEEPESEEILVTEEEQEPEKIIAIEEKPEPVIQTEPEKISDDDMEILIDFVSEAEENLDTIEVSLIDLEQDPTNKDIINDIFRPFHTIKGVSGFLSLTKINKLSHTTENLLDSARSGDFVINNTATDAILESVDALKNLLERVKQGTSTGFKQSDDDININHLRDKLQNLQTTLTKGGKEPLGEILVRKGVLNKESLDQSLENQQEFPEKKLGEILVEEKKAAPKQVASALMEQNLSKKQVVSQVKVSTQKLDDLVDYAGELVIAQSMLKQKTSNDPSLSQNVAQLGLIVSNMQNIAMSMRMIPIKATFMKMIRLVRDLSRKSGKDVALNMVGEETEIDRNVVDALYEPMVHMIRNSVDHGIEAKTDRLKLGKSSQGQIVLRAYHKGGHIIIEIEDDGKGLDKDGILEKAKSTGLITGNEQMTDAQIYDLILQPGFSTAKQITDVSGRGVGMDVVKDGIEKFRGQLHIESSKGAGTKFTISLPLTLAIIDGMLVRVDDERYVIPTIAIQKAFKPEKEDYFTVRGKGEMVKDRGNLIPLIRLNEIYNSSSQKKIVWDGLVVVVESKEEKRALLIDELLGKDEYVIKSLGTNLEDVEGLAGGAILADGRVGLILDIHGIFSLVSHAR
ncbi:chemotaxis protein CheA [Desulfobacula toluolica]|uniref:chemotaxis protein CheA n=1 Tax=Desulfobacula toluolica TaxID=28223 RepID=UPI0003109163|nr:chemotaxis protein CheA [Desulfobacula toluolica]